MHQFQCVASSKPASTAHSGFFPQSELVDFIAEHRPLASPTQLSNSLGQAYRASAPEAQFATASTIFRHDRMYASAVHRWLPPSVNTVVEVGGGSGALACDLLAECERVMSFHHVEISPELAEVQRKAAAAAGVAQRHRVHVKSFFDWNWAPNRALGATRDDANVALLAFEVFDNLACDKLVVLPDGTAKQAFVETRADGYRFEIYRDVSDSLVSRCLALWLATHAPPRDMPRGFVLWLPTGVFQFIEHVKSQFGPKVSLLIADFDEFPNDGVGVVGINAPLVQRKSLTPNDTLETFSDPLRAPLGQCDILFPTSFEFVRRCFGDDRQLVIEKHADFLAQYAPTMPRAAREFYGNMSVLRSR
jgi:hypothetical protein